MMGLLSDVVLRPAMPQRKLEFFRAQVCPDLTSGECDGECYRLKAQNQPRATCGDGKNCKMTHRLAASTTQQPEDSILQHNHAIHVLL